MKISGAVETLSLRKTDEAIYAWSSSIDLAGMRVNVGPRSMTDLSSHNPWQSIQAAVYHLVNLNFQVLPRVHLKLFVPFHHMGVKRTLKWSSLISY